MLALLCIVICNGLPRQCYGLVTVLCEFLVYALLMKYPLYLGCVLDKGFELL